MKSLLIKLAIVSSLVLLFSACDKNDDLDNLNVTAVQTLYEPTDGKTVVLQPSPSASLYFEWEPAKAEDGGMVLYEIVFDKEGGDFTDPVYRMVSDIKGGANYATITHKVLNKIADYAGIGSSETGTIQWTVYSSKGINEVKAAVNRTLEITRLSGFSDIPVDVYVTGEASEGGTELSMAMMMKSTATGEFEIYTRLLEGQTYYFTDTKTGSSPKRIFTENGLLKEGPTGSSTVNETGVYHIKLDFNTGAAVYAMVTDFELFFCPTNSFLFSHEYIGNGIWKASNMPITFKEESWGRDERYKFKMTKINAADETVEVWWGVRGNDSRPNPDSPPSYYYLTEGVSDNQWDDKFKFAGEMDNALVDVTIYLNADGPYTHSVVKVGNQ